MSDVSDQICALCGAKPKDGEVITVVAIFDGHTFLRSWRVCAACTPTVRADMDDLALNLERGTLFTFASLEAMRGDLVEPLYRRYCFDCRHAEIEATGERVACRYVERERGDRIAFGELDFDQDAIDPGHAMRCHAYDVAGESVPGGPRRGR